MSLTETVIEGTLKPDGTLELDHKPDLPPGRVTVRMQPLAVLPEGDPFFDMLKGIWATREQAGLTPRTVEEVESLRRQLRDDSQQEILEIGRLQEDRGFFSSPQVKMVPVTAATWETAAQIAATDRLKPLDSIHLAAAVEHGCGLFLTNDSQLSRCTAIPVELLT